MVPGRSGIENRQDALDRLWAALRGNPHWVAFAVATAGLLVHTAMLQPWTMDDTFIHLRYAAHLIAGDGLVYNAGERVEGYTSFLWVCMLGVGGALGLELLALAKILGTAFAIGALALLANIHRFLPGVDRKTSALATLLLASSGAFTAWAAAGMETPLVALLGLVLCVVHCRSMQSHSQPWRVALVGALGAIGVMARPDFVVLLCVVGLDRLAADLRQGRWHFLLFAGAFVLVYGPYYAWRFAYYGYLLPNTFYVKVGSSLAQISRGLDYVGDFAWVGLVLIVPALVLLVVTRGERARAWRVGALLGMLLLHSVYVALVGGDVMPAYRFFVHVLPLLCLAAALAFNAWASRPRWLAAVGALMIATNIAHTAFDSHLDRAVRVARVGDIGAEVGRWLHETMPPDTVIAVNAAGAIAYYSGFRVIDMLGLNDVHIAHRHMPRMGKGIPGHEKGDGAYVLSRRPDLIQFGPSWGQVRPMFVGDRELKSNSEFQDQYSPVTYTMPSGQVVHFYQRIDWSPRP